MREELADEIFNEEVENKKKTSNAFDRKFYSRNDDSFKNIIHKTNNIQY